MSAWQRKIFKRHPHLLRSLVAVEGEASSSTLHDDARTQSTEDTRLVVLGRVELSDNNVIWVV